MTLHYSCITVYDLRKSSNCYSTIHILFYCPFILEVMYFNAIQIQISRCVWNDKWFPVWMLINSKDTIKKINILDQDGWIDYIIAEQVNRQLKW